MTNPLSRSRSDEHLDAALSSLQSQLETSLADPVAAPPTPPRPVAPAAGAGGQLWGPSSPRVTSPLQLLLEVANNAHRLKKQVEALLDGVTGEPPPIRTRAAPKLPHGLLPALSALAHEIEVTHAEIGQFIAHLRAKL